MTVSRQFTLGDEIVGCGQQTFEILKSEH